MTDQKIRFVFSTQAYNTILAETLHMDPKETGGILLGHAVDSSWYVLESIEPGPGSIFKEYYFEYDHEFVNYLARARARRYEFPLTVLGLWHRHPGSMDHFSATDDATNLAFARLSPQGAISALVNLDPGFRLTLYHFEEKLDYARVPFLVSDQAIPDHYFRMKYQDQVPKQDAGPDFLDKLKPENTSTALRNKLERVSRPRTDKDKVTVYAPAWLPESGKSHVLLGFRGEQPHYFNITETEESWMLADPDVRQHGASALTAAGFFLGHEALKEAEASFNLDFIAYYKTDRQEFLEFLGRHFREKEPRVEDGFVVGYGTTEGLVFYFIDPAGITRCSVEPYAIKLDVFSRNTGILETDVMNTTTAVISGCGSVGSYAALELARSGVGNFLLVDHDTLSYANICRHQCGLADVGRYKVDAVAERIRMINPGARIEVVRGLLESVPGKILDRFCGPGAVIIGCADNREGDQYAGKMAAHYHMPVVAIGFWERAFAGEVFYWIPDRDDQACYHCFVSALGDISGRASVNRRLYTNQDDLSKVNFMPGISVDITFVTNIGVKIVLDILNRNTRGYIPRLLDSLTQFTLIANTNKTEIGGPQATLFSYPLQVTTSVVVEKIPGCKLCGKIS